MHPKIREKDAWVIDDIGGRSQFEDSHCLILDFMDDPTRVFCGIFDGHSGRSVADLAAGSFSKAFQEFLMIGTPPAEALRKTFLKVDMEAVSLISGAVAVVFYIQERELFFANAGDAELLLVSKRSHHKLTELHRLTNQEEQMRVIKAGAKIIDPYVMLPNGHGLQCTRSLGDHDFRSIGVIPDPFVGSRQLDSDDLWLIGACDGLWDVITSKEVAAISRRFTSAKSVVEALHHEAIIERNTMDNLTIVAVRATRKPTSTTVKA